MPLCSEFLNRGADEIFAQFSIVNKSQGNTNLFCDDSIHALLACQGQTAFLQYLVFPPLKVQIQLVNKRNT